ncbi:MAG: hypothetical protein JWM91_3700 [Rhodospirillales bacterium]|nr:hypothetical protein [Rhodospirillales bacterium]
MALTAQRLAELDRLRDIGLEQAERLTAVSGLLSPEQEFRRMTGGRDDPGLWAQAIRRILGAEAPPQLAPSGLCHSTI